MNWRRGFFRVWLLCSLLWISLIAMGGHQILEKQSQSRLVAMIDSLAALLGGGWPSLVATAVGVPFTILVAGLAIASMLTTRKRITWLILFLLYAVFSVWFLQTEPGRAWLGIPRGSWNSADELWLLAAITLGVPLVFAALIWALTGFRPNRLLQSKPGESEGSRAP